MDGKSDIPCGGRGRKRTVHTTRRVWTFEEECELMCALNDLVVKGYKCDNGFKSGYLLLLENMLVIKFPGTGLKGEPHINSKFMSGRVIPGVWDAQYKVDPFTKSLRNRAFPFYAQWGEIFGNDRANQLYNDVVQEDLNTGSKHHHSTMDMDEDGESLYVNQNETTEPISFLVDETSSATKSNRIGSKRKYGEGIEVQFLDTMGNLCDASNTNFGQITETMGHIVKHVGSEYDNRMRREHVYDALGCMDFITVEARVDAAGYLCNNSKDMDLFFSLPDEAKNVMVTRIMRKLAGGG
ncbi:hypothetical protein ACS0TY_005947 [Phlomoides rotata]